MSPPARPEILLTAHARLDAGFPDALFITIKRYPVTPGEAPTAVAHVATVDEALATVGAWLEEFRSSGQ